MFKNFNDIVNTIKNNKKLFYAVNLLLLLVVISLLLKDPKIEENIMEGSTESESNINTKPTDYVNDLELKLEEILNKIQGVEYVKVMLYTKNTPKLVPIIDEDKNQESTIEIGADGLKREILKENTQKKVLLNKDSTKVFEKYYEYPEITGILVVANYSNSEKTKKDILESVKTLLNLNYSEIEVVAAQSKGKGN